MWRGPMFHGLSFAPPPGASSSVLASMSPGMDAPWLSLNTPVSDLRVHMEHHEAFKVNIEGRFDDLEFLLPCADLITALHVGGKTTIKDPSALASLTRLRHLGGAPANADALLPTLPHLRRLDLAGEHTFEVLAHCGELRELALGRPSEPWISALNVLPPLPNLAQLTIVGPELRSLAGIERFVGLRTLVLRDVHLRDTIGREFLLERFGFDRMKSLMKEADVRLDADHVALRPRVVETPPLPAVSPEHPACILLLLDRSRSTEQPIGLDLRVVLDADADAFDEQYGKGPDADKPHCEAYTDAINRYLDRLCRRVPGALRAHVHVGVIEFGAKTGWAWDGDLKGRSIVSVAEIDAHPLRSRPSRIWLEPIAAGETPLGEAMELAAAATADWIAMHPDALPPTVICVSSGHATGDDTRRNALAIRRLSTPLGSTTLCHIVREDMYGRPEFEAEGYHYSEFKRLFPESSRLPAHIVAATRAAQYVFHEPLRGYFDGATEADVENLLHVFTSFPGLDWTADLIHHPLPPVRISDDDITDNPYNGDNETVYTAADWRAPKVQGRMGDAVFWKVINFSRDGIESLSEQTDRLSVLLAQLKEPDLVAWQRLLLTKMNQAHRWDLWAVASIVMDGCTEKEFEQFRAWLVGQGRQAFEGSLESPERAAKGIDGNERPLLDGFLTVANEVYKTKFGRDDFLERVNVETRDVPAGKKWKDADLPRLFPKLIKWIDKRKSRVAAPTPAKKVGHRRRPVEPALSPEPDPAPFVAPETDVSAAAAFKEFLGGGVKVRKSIAYLTKATTPDQIAEWREDTGIQGIAFDDPPAAEQLAAIEREVLIWRPDVSIKLKATDKKPWDLSIPTALPSHTRLTLDYYGDLPPKQLSELGRFTTLTTLSLTARGLKDWSFLSALPPSLEHLSLGKTTGKKKGVRALARLPHLRQLKFVGPVDDPAAFGELTTLEELEMESISHPDLSFLRTLDGLTHLRILHGTLGSLDGIEALRSLRTLTFWQTRGITNLDSILGLRELRTLSLNTMSDIVALPDMLPLRKLQAIDLRTMKRLRDVSGAARAPNLARFMFFEAETTHTLDDFDALLQHPTLKGVCVMWRSNGTRMRQFEARATAAGKIGDVMECHKIPVEE